jgi:hypothetical protein
MRPPSSRLLITYLCLASLFVVYLVLSQPSVPSPTPVFVMSSSVRPSKPTTSPATTLPIRSSSKPSVSQKPTQLPHPVLRLRQFNSAGKINGYPCGGDLPPCWVLRRESHGDPKAENPHSSASGLWQIVDGTWAHFAGYSHASLAPPSVQNHKAILLWAHGAGCGHWSACGR